MADRSGFSSMRASARICGASARNLREKISLTWRTQFASLSRDSSIGRMVQPPEPSDSASFVCERLRARLSQAACGRNYICGAAFACQGCELGRQHASMLTSREVSASKQQTGAAARLASRAGVCVRCGRLMIRLVRSHTICISCFNREAEIRRGRNAKGGQPQKWRELLRFGHAEVSLKGRMHQVDLGLCSGPSEAARAVQRRWPGCSLVRYWADADPPAAPECRPIAPVHW